MKRPFNFLPSFKWTCWIVCGLYTLLVGGLFAQGLMPAMSQYQVPAAQLESPHYYDAILWVYVHMQVLALIIGALGIWVHDGKAQVWLSRVICATHAVYVFLDFRSSDTVLGNALYKGPASIFPAIIGTTVFLLFLHLSFGKAQPRMSVV